MSTGPGAKHAPMRLGMALLALGALPATAQSTRALVKEGNGQYEAGKYADAEASYRKALEKEPSSVQAQFDLGNALYKQGRFEAAAKAFEGAAREAKAPDVRAQAFYNLGNAQLKAKQEKEAVASYIESLKLRPGDADAKYNLSYALARQKEQQQQQQNKNDKQDKKDKKDQQDKQDQGKDPKDKGKDPKSQPQDGQNPQDKKPQDGKSDPPKQERKMSKQEAERILAVIKDSDKDTRKKLKPRPAARAKTEKDW